MEQTLVVEEQARSVELSGMRQVLKARVEGAKAESENAQAQLQLVSHHVWDGELNEKCVAV